MTIDQDRCRSATHSLQQSHVDNIPPPSTASDARSSPLRAFSCPALASKPHGRARPLWRPSGAPAAASARGPWRGSARRPRAPGARGRGPGRGSRTGRTGPVAGRCAVPGMLATGHVALAVLCPARRLGLDLLRHPQDDRLGQLAVGSQRVTGVAQQAELHGEAEAVGVAASLADQRQVGVVEGVVADQVIPGFPAAQAGCPAPWPRGSSDAACVSRPCGGTGRGFPG